MLVADDHRHFAVGHGVQFLRKIRSAFGTAHIRRSDNQFLEVQRGYVRRQHIGAKDMIYGNVKESLDLVGVQIHRDNTVSSRRLEHVCYQFGTDRNTGFVLAVLACPSEIGDDGYHFVRACAFGRIDHQQ